MTGLNNKRFVSHLESYTESTCVPIKAHKNKLKMPLREERVVLHNKVYSANKVWKDARARACRLNIKNDSSNNVQGYRRCFMLHRQMYASARSPLFFTRCGANFFANLSIKFNIVLNFQLLTWLSKWVMKLNFRLWNLFIALWKECGSTVKPWFDKPLHEELLSITNDFCGPSNSKLYWKEPWYNKTLL